MQLVTNPTQFCSTAVGRSLLAWYMQFEDYCCFLAAYKLLLPHIWRTENVRIRQELAEADYPRLSGTERISRILDDAWAYFLALVPNVSDVVYGVPQLTKLGGQERLNAARQLDNQLRNFEHDIQDFLNSTHVLEALAPVPTISLHSHGLRHTECCPRFPLSPYAMQYSPSGKFRITIFGFKCYIWAVLYPPIREAIGNAAREITFEAADICSIEVCKTFAWLEDSLGDNPDNFLPVFSSLVLSTTTCPPELRVWLWCKLVHFETLGHLSFDPIKRNLASLWNMPEIITERHPPSTDSAPPQILSEPYCEDIEATMKDIKLNEEETSSGLDDSELEPLTRGRGLYGLSEEC